MQKSIYFSKIMALSQSYNEGNHKSHKDFPIDETYGDTSNKGEFLAPFDCKIVKKYEATTRQIWLTSTSEVETPKGNHYVSILIGHVQKNEYDKLSVGHKFKQGEHVVYEGIDKKSTGYHNHVSSGFGKLKGSGWYEEPKGIWNINTKENAQKPEDVFYINNVIIYNDKNLKWKTYNTEKTKYYTTLDDMYIRTSPNGGYVKVKDCSEKMKNALKYQEPNAKAVIKKGITITCLEEVKSGSQLWCRNYNGYVCIKGKTTYMVPYED